MPMFGYQINEINRYLCFHSSFDGGGICIAIISTSGIRIAIMLTSHPVCSATS